MPSFSSPIPPPIFDSDESDAASQQSNDSNSYLSSQFNQHTRLSFSPKLTSQVLPPSSIQFDESISQHDYILNDSINMETTLSRTPSEISWKSTTSYTVKYANKKRKRTDDISEQLSLKTPNQSPCTRRKNLDYVQETIFQSPKIQRRSRHHDESINLPSTSIYSNLVNINPFTSTQNVVPTHRYHTRLVAKRESPSLRQLMIPRFEQEFHHESFLGYGEFSHVYLCINRLNGLNYAIKSSKQTIIGTSYEQIAWREICAYGTLISHENLVRYYSSWIEPDGRFFIQLEYCNGGSLEDLLDKNREQKIVIDEYELKNLLHQLSDVLSFMHGQDLAHLDIKPSNIMLCQYADKNILYKLTDLGHVSQISLCSIDEDGDSRYLALEAIQKSNSKQLNLDKCDIFSLGLTIYVCATNYNMPKQGNEWQQLRLNICQYLHSISQCTKQFNDLLLQRMCNVDPNQRPSACELLLDPVANPSILTSRESLRYSLKQERDKNSLLNKKLLNQYLLTNSSDLQILPTSINDINNSNLPYQQIFVSPTQSTNVPQYQYTSTPNDNSRLLLIHTPTGSINHNQSIPSPVHCGSYAMKQHGKLAGSNMFRYYSSII